MWLQKGHIEFSEKTLKCMLTDWKSSDMYVCTKPNVKPNNISSSLSIPKNDEGKIKFRTI